MTRRWRWMMALSAAATAIVAAQQGSGRDGASAATGTASVSGIVVDDATGQPIRHVDVRLAVAVSQVKAVNTDAEGRFRLDGLAAGRYVIYLRSPLYVPSQYGASTPGSPGRLIDVADGAQVSGLVARLTRGAVISGTVFTSTGEPASNVGVQLLRRGYSRTTGEPSLVSESGRSTDDLGRYRFFGIPAGEYFVASTAEPWRPLGGISGLGEEFAVHVVTHDDVEAVRRGTPMASMPQPSRERMAPTFYPGVTRASDATVVPVAAAQERHDVDITLRSVPQASIRGKLSFPSGVKPIRTSLQLLSVDSQPLATSARPYPRSEDATFNVANVPPGEYVLSAQAYLTLETTPAATQPPILFATVPVSVDGRDVNDVVIVMRPGVSVSGRVQLAGGAQDNPALDVFRIGLTPVVSTREVLAAPAPVVVGADGRFTILGVPPGRFVVTVTVGPRGQSAGGGAWHVATAMWMGVNAADVPLDIRDEPVSDLPIVLSRAATGISGTLQLPSGDPALGYWVIVFATDRANWRPGSRRVQGAQVRSDGSYGFGTLPPGEYFVAVTSDAEAGRWYNPAFLEQLLAVTPIRVTLAEGDRKTQDIQISR